VVADTVLTDNLISYVEQLRRGNDNYKNGAYTKFLSGVSFNTTDEGVILKLLPAIMQCHTYFVNSMLTYARLVTTIGINDKQKYGTVLSNASSNNSTFSNSQTTADNIAMATAFITDKSISRPASFNAYRHVMDRLARMRSAFAMIGRQTKIQDVDSVPQEVLIGKLLHAVLGSLSTYPGFATLQTALAMANGTYFTQVSGASTAYQFISSISFLQFFTHVDSDGTITNYTGASTAQDDCYKYLVATPSGFVYNDAPATTLPLIVSPDCDMVSFIYGDFTDGGDERTPLFNLSDLSGHLVRINVCFPTLVKAAVEVPI
jgi:hypothetical protein